MLLPFLTSVAFAWTTVVAVAEGDPSDPTVEEEHGARTAPVALPGGWVPVLADCLEERQPRRWSVVDRAAARAESSDIDLSSLRPAVVVLGLGGPELAVPPIEASVLRARIERRISRLLEQESAPGLLLVGPVRVEGASPEAREELDRTLADIAARHEGVYHLDPVLAGPLGEGPPTRTAEGNLTWQGHARVAAAVCDAILGHWPTPH